MRVVNLYGGPGTGKSTTSAALFAELKYRGVDAELVREFAKDLVWQRRIHDMRILGFIIGEQAYRLATVAPQVQVTITDSPLLLTLAYDPSDAQKALAVEMYRQYDNLDIFLERSKEYNPNGRTQTEAEAKLKDEEIREVLRSMAVPFVTMPATRAAVWTIIQILEQRNWVR